MGTGAYSASKFVANICTIIGFNASLVAAAGIIRIGIRIGFSKNALGSVEKHIEGGE